MPKASYYAASKQKNQEAEEERDANALLCFCVEQQPLACRALRDSRRR